MTNEFLYNYIRQHKFAVLATVSPENTSESAAMGIAVTSDLKIIFDTVSDSRKYVNLLSNPNVSFVIGWENGQTIQYEGTSILIDTANDHELLQTYFAVFPDGEERMKTWKNIVYFCVTPKWIRHTDFSTGTKKVGEVKF